MLYNVEDDPEEQTNLAAVEQVIKTARTRWGGHTDLQIELTSLRVYEEQLRAQLDMAPRLAAQRKLSGFFLCWRTRILFGRPQDERFFPLFS